MLVVKKRAVWALALTVVVAVVGYVIIANQVYVIASRATCTVDEAYRGNVPHRFGYAEQDLTQPDILRRDFNYRPYWVEAAYRLVDIPTPDGVVLRGWWLPAQEPTKRTVIILGGIRASKERVGLLLQLSMLHRQGFHVLLADYRNHGASDCPTGLVTAGHKESDDVLAMRQWLQQSQGIPPSSIGIMATSMGALTALLALAKDAHIPAIALDAPPYDFAKILTEEVAYNGLPTWFVPGAIALFRLRAGIDVYNPSPKLTAASANTALLVMYSEQDTRVRPHHAQQLIEDAKRLGLALHVLRLQGAHADGILWQPALYEKAMADFFDRYLPES